MLARRTGKGGREREREVDPDISAENFRKASVTEKRIRRVKRRRYDVKVDATATDRRDVDVDRRSARRLSRLRSDRKEIW